ncbi:DNA-binding protein [Fodinibius sp. AD559]|uniref:DNA-binding protein n=1 Tax=Fodinibius sp. AD559 TaxID=3424179 RepID=UPI0040469A5C
MNTQEVIKNLKLVGGSLALLTAAGIAYGISRGLKYRKRYERDFDPDKVEELKGEVLEISPDSEKHDETRGKILMLETENGKIIPVHLGPEWFLSNQQNKIKEGYKITVIGSLVKYHNNDVMIAAQIQYGDNKLILRDESGFPRWQGWVE